MIHTAVKGHTKAVGVRCVALKLTWRANTTLGQGRLARQIPQQVVTVSED